jgi:ribosomal protein L21
MTNYQVTIGYKAVVSVDVKANNEKEAKEKAIEVFKKQKDKIYNRGGVYLQDDNYKPDGILNMDSTWNMYDK